MTKTVTGLTIGINLPGQIVSIEDPLGKYSTTLKNTPYADISIKKALQMRSGINVYDPEGHGEVGNGRQKAWIFGQKLFEEIYSNHQKCEWKWRHI